MPTERSINAKIYLLCSLTGMQRIIMPFQKKQTTLRAIYHTPRPGGPNHADDQHLRTATFSTYIEGEHTAGPVGVGEGTRVFAFCVLRRRKRRRVNRKTGDGGLTQLLMEAFTYVRPRLRFHLSSPHTHTRDANKTTQALQELRERPHHEGKECGTSPTAAEPSRDRL